MHHVCENVVKYLESVGVYRDVAKIVAEFAADHPVSWCKLGILLNPNERPTFRWVSDCACIPDETSHCSYCPGQLMVQLNRAQFPIPRDCTEVTPCKILIRVTKQFHIRLFRSSPTRPWNITMRRRQGHHIASVYEKELFVEMLAHHWGPCNWRTGSLIVKPHKNTQPKIEYPCPASPGVSWAIPTAAGRPTALSGI